MNKKFDIISTILIVTLTIILIAFVFNYFTNSDKTTLTNTNLPFDPIDMDVQSVSGSEAFVTSTPVDLKDNNNSNEEHIIDTIMSGEQPDKIVSDSGETATGIIDNIKENDMPAEPPKDTNPVIITSNDNVSDKEKKEVLKELDETLMDLLDVIETVKIVDESRLPTDGSEVQP